MRAGYITRSGLDGSRILRGDVADLLPFYPNASEVTGVDKSNTAVTGHRSQVVTLVLRVLVVPVSYLGPETSMFHGLTQFLQENVE